MATTHHVQDVEVKTSWVDDMRGDLPHFAARMDEMKIDRVETLTSPKASALVYVTWTNDRILATGSRALFKRYAKLLGAEVVATEKAWGMAS